MAKCLTIPYTGEALKIFDLFHTLWTWNPNETYIHEGRVYYVNSKGYMHFYYFERRKDIDGNPFYLLIDYLLTKAAKLREVSRISFSDRETAYNYGLALTDEATRNTAAITGTDAPTSEETPEPVQNTTTPEMEPENGTQAAKTTDMETFAQAYHNIYTELYNHCGEPETDERERYYCILFDANMDELQPIIAAFAAYRGDLVTSDREAAAFMIALETVGTPTAPQDATQGTESTTGDQTPAEGAKAPYSATGGGNRITYGATTTPRLRECPRTNGTSTGRTSTHRTHQKPATGRTESRPEYQPRQPGPAKSNFFRLDVQNRIRSTENLGVPHFFEGFLKKLIRNFRGLKTKK